MSAPTIPVNCACCGRRGLHHGRGLIGVCYLHHFEAGTLHRFPPTRTAKPIWQPASAHGRMMLDRYRALTGLPVERIAFELGVSTRSVQRYAAYEQWRTAREEVAA